MMRVFREPDSSDWQRQVGSATLGAIGGLVAGALLSRILLPAGSRAIASRGTPAERFRPAPMQRPRLDQPELDRLETAVLGEFMLDPHLRDRGIEIGAISNGIVELSGTVRSQDEVRRAVAIANRVAGVETVVNRLNIERPYRTPSRQSTASAGGSLEHNEARVGGMGRRRQGHLTEPLQRDDSQSMREGALSAADRDQLADEGFAGPPSVNRAASNPTNFDEDELDNQDPHGKHARTTLDRPQEALNSFARVGERSPPATELRMEASGRNTSEEAPAERDEAGERQM